MSMIVLEGNGALIFQEVKYKIFFVAKLPPISSIPNGTITPEIYV